jgi:hypothetical protein
MKARRSLSVAVAAISLAGLACDKPAATTSGPTLDDSALFPADAGDCSDRARVHPMCLDAVTRRCYGQLVDCESSCEAQFGQMPGNSDKEPGLRGDIESGQCRQGCGNTYAVCKQNLLARCPQLCPAVPSSPPQASPPPGDAGQP